MRTTACCEPVKLEIFLRWDYRRYNKFLHVDSFNLKRCIHLILRSFENSFILQNSYAYDEIMLWALVGLDRERVPDFVSCHRHLKKWVPCLGSTIVRLRITTLMQSMLNTAY